MSKNGKSNGGAHEIDRLRMQRAASEVAAALQGGRIIAPEAAKEAEQQSYMAEYSNLWKLRDEVLLSMLDGTAVLPRDIAEVPSAKEVVDVAESIAKEVIRRRCVEAIKIGALTGGKTGPGFRFLAESLGIDVDAETALSKPAEIEPKLITAH